MVHGFFIFWLFEYKCDSTKHGKSALEYFYRVLVTVVDSTTQNTPNRKHKT